MAEGDSQASTGGADNSPARNSMIDGSRGVTGYFNIDPTLVRAHELI